MKIKIELVYKEEYSPLKKKSFLNVTLIEFYLHLSADRLQFS